MPRVFTLEYWTEDDWYVGRLREVPGVFSQGESLEELEFNIQDAYRMTMADETVPPTVVAVATKEVSLEL